MSETLYGFRCEYCAGTVPEKRVDREAFNHAKGVVILENVPIGECDRCHAHYYSAAVLRRVESLVSGSEPFAHTEQVPVTTF
jgi:YgiT-type zinc finger domain-containing protein